MIHDVTPSNYRGQIENYFYFFTIYIHVNNKVNLFQMMKVKDLFQKYLYFLFLHRLMDSDFPPGWPTKVINFRSYLLKCLLYDFAKHISNLADIKKKRIV